MMLEYVIKVSAKNFGFENAIEWLTLSGITSKIYGLEDIQKPLENYKNIDSFKIYVSDIGLLCAKKEIVPEDILYLSKELNDFKGGMTENYVNVQILTDILNIIGKLQKEHQRLIL